MKYWAGIDLGGTNIVCGLVDEDLNLLGKLKQPTEAAKGSGFVLERMAAMVKQLLEETGIPLNELQGLGSVVPDLLILKMECACLPVTWDGEICL
ncbi:hypothetical protein [Paenibacillus larvae]|uniref:hypothetical protein n=1 Tax=Paenibacillus larvae TaxID=1464 RepID=UPI00267BFC0F|nr:hypothetical protein [Paenibacillus larvae]